MKLLCSDKGVEEEMVRPSSCDIFGSTWSIVYEPTVRSQNLFGQTNDIEHTIHIDAGISEEQQRVTLLHELCHAILMTIKGTLEADEHALVYQLSQGFWHLSKHNKELWRWLFDGGET